ncbi:ATP-dependent DNA helicase [Trichonephila clavipes]|nr:ATP-dependent DNA helicase [Trichonephila clavipes]
MPMRKGGVWAGNSQVAVCGLNKHITLWENHKEDITEDFLHQERRNNPIENIEYYDALFNNTLLILEDKILSITGNKLWHCMVCQNQCMINLNRQTYSRSAASVYSHHWNDWGSERGDIVFLDAPGGTGETFLLNLLLAFVRKDEDMAVAVASSGIAATLLAGG